MTITRMLTNGANRGTVLQGFFRVGRLRAHPAAAVQLKEPAFWIGKAPRPELMPAMAHRPAVQPKAISASPPGSAWHGALRAELLPGMGRSRFAPSPAVAQPRAAGGVTTSPVPDGVLRIPGNGKPLDDGIRARMERCFNADFSAVRVHESPAAQAMGALAFTLGDSLYFAPGRYAPTTRAGVELLGHELTHVVQQRGGRVANPYGRGAAIVQDPDLEAEADAMGRQIAAHWAHESAPTARHTETTIQRAEKKRKRKKPPVSPPSSESDSDERPAPKKQKVKPPPPPPRRSSRLDNPWLQVTLYNQTKAIGHQNRYVKVSKNGDHAACIIEHDGYDYVFNGNDSRDWEEAPPDGFEDYSDIAYRPLMARETGLLHHPELLKLKAGQKGVCYAAAHACAIIYQHGDMDWDEFVSYVQKTNLVALVTKAKELE